MQVESEIAVERPRSEVFAFVARAERLPEYVTDFEWVRQASDGEPGPGTTYSYKMARGRAQGTFEWTEFNAPAKLAWRGPPVSVGLGSMKPAGWWELAERGDGTQVKLVMAPTPGGLFKVLAPFLSSGMRKGNEQALQRLKRLIESEPGSGQGGSATTLGAEGAASD